MSEEIKVHELTRNPQDIPVPIVNFGRWTNLLFLLTALLTNQPWLTTVLFILILPGFIFWGKWNVVGRIGKKLLASKIKGSLYEDKKLIWFNNLLLVIMIFLTQIAFIAGNFLIGWGITLMAITANGFALAGYCVGCVIYYRFRLYRYMIFGEKPKVV
jgi:hypothetical protein